MPNRLMFEVGVKEVDKKISELRKEFDSFEAKYGQQGIQVKLNLQGAIGDVQALIDALKNVGDTSKLKQYEEEIAKLKKQIDALQATANGTGSSTAAGVDQTKKSVNTATERIQYLLNILKDVKNQSIKFGDANFDVTRLDNIFNKLMKIKQELTEIQNSGGLHPVSGKTANQLMSEQNISGIERNLKMELSYYKQIETEFERIEKLKAGLQNVLGGITDPAKQQEIRQTITNLENLQGLVTRMGTNDARFIFGGKEYKDNMANANVLLKESVSNVKAYEKAQQKAATEEQKSVNQAAIQWEKLGVKIRDLQALRDKGVKLGLDPTEINNYIKEIAKLRAELYNIQNGANNGKSLGKYFEGGLYTNQLMAKADVQRPFILGQEAAAKFGAEVKTATSNVNQLTLEEQKLAQALNKTSQEMNHQSQMMSDLKTMAYQYLSVWGAQTFLSNIIEIGGQLEMQRMSIGSILQNVSQANTLFDRIKSLAIKSPFGVVELDQMTKQLTAYGFKYNELFDMTKRLADISAATGTGVDRLALALGHVRSEAALSGYTLRQFAMGNVPLLGKLSEKLGKTTEEIRKMVRGKQISYEDVVGVLKDLTNEGGMFYNMQEVISESVKAKFKNVRDALSIMYGEMAEGGPGDALKEVAKALMEITTSWRDVTTVMGTGLALWGMHRVAVLSYSKVLGAANAQQLATIATFRKQQVAQTTLAWTYRELTAVEKNHTILGQMNLRYAKMRQALNMSLSRSQQQLIMRSREEIVADTALALSKKKLSTEDIVRQVALGRLTKAEGVQVLMLAKLTDAERAAGIAAVNNVRTYGMFTGVINGAAIAVGRLVLALKSLLFNPAMIAMAGITAVMEMWQRNNREMEEAEEISKKIYDHSQDALKNTSTVLESTGIKAMWRGDEKSAFSDVTGKFGNQMGGEYKFELPQFDADEAKTSIETWSQYIRDYAATPNRILNEALFDTEGNVRSLKDQFDNLKVAVEDVARAQITMKDLPNAFENAVNATDEGMLNDNVLTNIKQYDKALRSFSSAVSTSYRKYNQAIDKGIEAAKKQDASFAKAVEGMGTYAQQFRFLIDNQDKYTKALTAFKKADQANGRELYRLNEGTSFFGLVGNTGLKDLKAAETEMNNDLEIYYTHLKAELQTKGWDLKNLTVEQQQSLLLSYKDQLSSIQGLSEEEANNLMKLFAKAFNIPLDVDDEKFRVKMSEVERLLGELIGRKWSVPVNFSTNITDVITEARKKYKIATEYFANVKPILLKFGVQWEEGKLLSQEQIDAAVASADENQKEFVRKALEGVNEATKIYNNAMDASKAGGFSLKDPNKGGNKGSQEDKEAKRLRERVRILKEANESYQYWRKLVGDTAAQPHVNEEFGKLLGEQGFKFKDAKQYEKTLEDLRKKYQGIYDASEKAGKKRPQLLEAIKEIDKVLADLGRKDFEKATEEFLSKTQIELDELTRSWEIFNSVREATGDVELAVRISGADYQGGKTRNLADALREKIQKDFDAAGGGIAFNPYLSDKDIQESIQKAMPQASEKQIKGFIEEYKKWRDLQRDVLKADIQTFSQLLGKAEDYESVIARINSNYSVQKESLDNLLNDYLSGKTDEKGNRLGITPDEYLKALGLLDASTDLEKFKQSSDYINLMNNSLGMTANAVEEAADALKIKLGVALKNNAISAKDYADEMAKLEDILRKYDANGLFGKNTAFASYITGGMQGVIQNYTDREQARRTVLANAKKSEEEIENDDLIKKYKKVQDALSKFANGLNSASATIDFFAGILQGFGDAAQQLSDMFDALGDSDAADTMSDIADSIGAITSGAQSLSSGLRAAVNGDVGGLVSGVVGTITSPITAFAMLNDKKHERRIQDLKKEITKIDNTLNTIKSLRERELGYDKGNLRRQLLEQYKSQEVTSSLFGNKISLTPTTSAMAEYYGRFNGGNGYSQEYNALIETRKKYMEMYDEENSKKKKSQDALEEYKTNIAALDEQIMFFTQDLAKELWSIDIQGWAEQIGDALWTAFENGEDAVEAFGDTARDIISNVAKDMWQLSILKPLFKELQETLFGQYKDGKYTGGTIKYDSNGNIDMQASEQPTLEALGQFFGKNGVYQQAIEGGQQFYEWVQKITGIDLSKESSSSASNSIKGITEQTADLPASYVNAIRADVSVDRGMIADYFPQYLAAMTSGNASLQNIEQNTAAIMRSNDAIQKSVADLYSDIHGLRTTTWKMPIA